MWGDRGYWCFVAIAPQLKIMVCGWFEMGCDCLSAAMPLVLPIVVM